MCHFEGAERLRNLSLPNHKCSWKHLLHRQYHLAEVLASFEIALRRAAFRQGKTFTDDDLELLIRHQFENVIELLEIFRLGFQIIRYRETSRFPSFGQDRRRIRNSAEGAADGKQPAARRERLQALLINVAADHFEHHVLRFGWPPYRRRRSHLARAAIRRF